MPEADREGGAGGASVTTPGGVPNLPKGALTLETLQAMLQDMSTAAQRQRAADRVPAIFDGSTAGNLMSDLSPGGIIAQLFAGFNSHVANADPADINGPEDLPGLLLDFIESLPVIGQLVGLLEAIVGTYDGDDPILIEIQKFFGLIRSLLGLISLDLDDLPTPAEVWTFVATVFLAPLNLFAIPSDVQTSINNALGNMRDALDGSYSGSGPIFLAIKAAAAAWLTGSSPLDSTKLTGTIGAGVLPDITPGMSTGMQGLIDGLLNAANNTSITGQAYSAVENAWAGLQTSIYNVFGGNNAARASQNDALEALNTIKDTIAQQGSAISTIQGLLDGANGFSAVVPFRPAETTTISTAGAFSYTAPSWFNTATDFLDAIVCGAGGGGGGGLVDDSTAGTDTVFKANGVTKVTGAGGTFVGPGPGGGIGASPGNQSYLDILYPGGAGGANTQPGTQPGGGGGGGNFFGVIGKGGYAGAWGATTLGPGATTAPFTGTVGTGGAGTSGGFGAREGGHGRAWVRARAAMPSSFTSMGNIPSLSGGAGALSIPLFRLNTGVAITDQMTAAASWTRIPPSTTTGGHVLIIRAKSDFTYFVYLRVWYTGGTTNWEIGRVVSSVRAPWKSGTIASAIPFNAFSISSDSARVFTIAINGIPFDSYSDNIAASSSMGPGFLSGGWGSSDSALPGSIQQFAFMDSGTPSRISSATVATSQTTSSTSYADLATVGPSVTLTVPQSGEVTVEYSAWTNHSAAGQSIFLSFAMSGSNTLAANDANSAQIRQMAISPGTLVGTVGRKIHLKGLTPGTTTFTLKYKTTAANATFADRHIIVEPKP